MKSLVVGLHISLKMLIMVMMIIIKILIQISRQSQSKFFLLQVRKLLIANARNNLKKDNKKQPWLPKWSIKETINK